LVLLKPGETDLLKESENPPISWPEGMSIEEFSGQWLVAHTKSRNEKALAHELITKEIKYFLPMNWKVRHTRGRKIRSFMPLFSGYLFFCGEEEQRLEVLRTNRVANIIKVKDQDKLLKELLQIEHALNAGADLLPHKYISKGQLCRVISGPFTGLQGIMIRTKGKTHLVLQVEMLGQASSVEIESDIIEVVD
jgi:transcriptional antiterminator RfaH